MSVKAKHPSVKRWRVTMLQAGKLGFFNPATYDVPIRAVRCENPVCIGGGFDASPVYDRIVSAGRRNNLPDGDYVQCSGMEQISKLAAQRHAYFNTLKRQSGSRIQRIRTWISGVRRTLFFLCLYAGSFSSTAAALEIGYSHLNPFNGAKTDHESILLRGEIAPGDYKALLDLIAPDQDRFLRSRSFVLASQGGDIQEALRIARLVRGTYSSVYVGELTGPCVSACFFIFSAAARREAGEKMLGIHRPYIHPQRLMSMSAREAETLQQHVLREARSYLEVQDVPTSLIDKMFQRASTEVYWLSDDEIQEQLGRRPPWYEQFLIARCGLDKSLERKYFATNNQALLDRVVATDDCGERMSLPEARAFLQSELANHSTQ